MSKYFLPPIIALLLTATLLSACGPAGVDGEGTNSDQSSLSVDLVWPEGFSVDRQTGLLSAPSDELSNTAPSYVTAVTLTLVSAGGDTYEFSVPLDTGEVSGTVPPGDYSISVVVNTDIGLTFTGMITKTLVLGFNSGITIDLVVNAPPVIVSLTASTTTPRPDEVVSLAVKAYDSDNEPMTYNWSASGGSLGGGDTTATWSATIVGTYTVTVTVVDARGGRATGSIALKPYNAPPVVTVVTNDNPTPLYLDLVNVTCAATDAEGDAITYDWTSSADGWTAAGTTATYIVSTPAETTLTCTATDFYGEVGTGTTILNAGSNGIPGAPQSVVAIGGTAQVTVTWGAVTNAISYNLYWGTAPGATVNLISGVASGYTHTGRADGTTYYYVVSAVTVAGEGPKSLEVSDITAPAVPTGLTATAGNGQVVLNWAPVTGAASYNVYWSTISGSTGFLINVVGTTYTHATANWQWQYYTVAAVNTTATSLKSTEAAAYPNSGALLAPAFVDLNAGSDSGISNVDNYTFNNPVLISWGAVVGAEGYMISRNGVFYSNVGNVTSASVPLFGGITGVKVWAYNNTVALTGPTTLLNITLDQAAPAYNSYSPALFCLSFLFPATISFNYTEPVWNTSVVITGGAGSATYSGGNNSFWLSYVVSHNGNIFANMVIQVKSQDRAGNAHTLNFTFAAPQCP